MTRSSRVLVVDDEVALAEIISSYFKKDGFDVLASQDGLDAVKVARDFQPDFIVLDLMLPGLDGVEVCKEIRKFSDAYIIMVTARDEEMDKIVGLAVGADDYMVKPFSTKELIARAHAMLRRPRLAKNEISTESLTLGDLVINADTRSVQIGGQLVELTRTEFDLLLVMARRPKVAYSRRQLLDAVWDESWYGDDHVVDVHVGHLRKKMDDLAPSKHYVHTVRGVGYSVHEVNR
jgi:DNA-binding response OmpR family regulator